MREQSAAIDWDAVTLTKLVASALAEPPGLRLILSEAMAERLELPMLVGDVVNGDDAPTP